MLQGEGIRRARERAQLTQEQLASLLGVSARTIGNWERDETVPRNRAAAVQAALGLDETEGPTLRSASDAELLGEIARRMSQRSFPPAD
ncbi:helix-turn-helix domain-containing protein [Pseudactinotalea terrae]|uniref:helix-turn-helix domain-containing protein n=1 Tax=Pseudactinotalea terrae TaxID=1743262 RepID=UPI001390998E|nr:helix-turn-helix transcriptional regulator [Pseudactinotalea terrae]